MYQNILVPLALDHGLAQTLFGIARHLLVPDGNIFALHVVEAPFGLATATQTDGLAQAAFDRAAALMQERIGAEPGVKGHVVEGHVYRGIVDFATGHSVGCIVMGSHRPGLSEYLIGSTAAQVVRHAECAVHVHRA